MPGGIVAFKFRDPEGHPLESLDDIDGVTVEVVSIVAKGSAPHVELLGYRPTRPRDVSLRMPTDVVASRLVFATTALGCDESVAVLADGLHVRLIHDPDCHAILLEHRP